MALVSKSVNLWVPLYVGKFLSSRVTTVSLEGLSSMELLTEAFMHLFLKLNHFV
jgi:hypothetical protein